MADFSDVQSALVALAVQAVYPNGTGQASVTGQGVSVARGWPNPQQLDADLKVGKCTVTVYPRPEETNTTRFPRDWQTLVVNAATLTLTAVGQVVTVGGTVPPTGNPHNLVVIVNGLPYVYAVQTSDTLTGIATALAALIAVNVPGTTNTGPVITLPNSARLTATRVGLQGTAIREIRRQSRLFQVSIWADTPAHRITVASAVDIAMASTQFLTLADGSAARLIYKNSRDHDEYQKDRLYRRDLFYSVEFATTQTETETQITVEQTNTGLQIDGSTAVGQIITNYQ